MIYFKLAVQVALYVTIGLSYGPVAFLVVALSVLLLELTIGLALEFVYKRG